MPQVGLEPTISAGQRPQTHTLDRSAIGIGSTYYTTYTLCNSPATKETETHTTHDIEKRTCAKTVRL